MLQAPGKIKIIKIYEMTRGKQKPKVSDNYISTMSKFFFVYFPSVLHTCTSNNNSHSEWYLTPALYTLIEKQLFLVYMTMHIYC
jgi:hypothetical protein